ncbi:DUF6924 domain-containing protein [Rathayibacter rathayi]|uniref:DUF6924 domain-containing protein n=1 Tax=Rathayibacter rathayi TaxID=33887 RepID=UPI003B969C56
MSTTTHVPVLRCDFSSDELWEQTRTEIQEGAEKGFQPTVEKVEDKVFDGLAADAFLEMVRSLPSSSPHPMVVAADATTMSSPEHTLLVAWAWKDEYEGQFLRCLPSDVLALENNVIDNLPWEEFYELVGEDGVLRME